MTFYYKQIIKIREDIYPKDYLYKQIVKAKLFIDTHFANNINLSHMAGETFFSKFHFLRLFKTIYGRTPYQYLTTVRIEKAKKLLQTNMAVTDVCFLVGFDSASSFTGLFKKITGSTPSAFLNNQKKQTPSMAKAPLKYIPGCFSATNI